MTKYVSDLVEKYPYLEGAEILEVIMPFIEDLLYCRRQARLIGMRLTETHSDSEHVLLEQQHIDFISHIARLERNLHDSIAVIERHFVD